MRKVSLPRKQRILVGVGGVPLVLKGTFNLSANGWNSLGQVGDQRGANKSAQFLVAGRIRPIVDQVI